jgi:hypothetical protein
VLRNSNIFLSCTFTILLQIIHRLDRSATLQLGALLRSSVVYTPCFFVILDNLHLGPHRLNDVVGVSSLFELADVDFVLYHALRDGSGSLVCEITAAKNVVDNPVETSWEIENQHLVAIAVRNLEGGSPPPPSFPRYHRVAAESRSIALAGQEP